MICFFFIPSSFLSLIFFQLIFTRSFKSIEIQAFPSLIAVITIQFYSSYQSKDVHLWKKKKNFGENEGALYKHVWMYFLHVENIFYAYYISYLWITCAFPMVDRKMTIIRFPLFIDSILNIDWIRHIQHTIFVSHNALLSLLYSQLQLQLPDIKSKITIFKSTWNHCKHPKIFWFNLNLISYCIISEI